MTALTEVDFGDVCDNNFCPWMIPCLWIGLVESGGWSIC